MSALPEVFTRYPRTHHLEGSKLQHGDESKKVTPFAAIRGAFTVVERKIDGANSGISFTSDGRMWLQSRGHFLTGGSFNEAQFDQFKAWAYTHQAALWDRLGDRYIAFGEQMAKKHTCFYDALPHLWLEFDIFDRATEEFLSTERRRELLAGLPVVSVPVVGAGTFDRLEDIVALLGPSLYKTEAWKENFEAEVRRRELDVADEWAHTDPADLDEGLYLKIERDGVVIDRLKWVRRDFVQLIEEQNEDPKGHVAFRPFVGNLLTPSVDLFAPSLVVPPPAHPVRLL